jgi:Epoxide hydrolase N terminus
VTKTGISSGRLYWENKLGFFDVKGVTVPAAVSVFPRELYQAARSWAERAYPNLIYFNEVDEGNRFAAWQEPELFTTELRAAFNSLRRSSDSSKEVVMRGTGETAVEIRPLHVEIPEEELDDLRRRLAATRWPSKELVADRSQAVQLATVQELARYWATDHDWRACEARLNALPQS